jgi:hypothetical protein
MSTFNSILRELSRRPAAIIGLGLLAAQIIAHRLRTDARNARADRRRPFGLTVATLMGPLVGN